MVGEPELLKSSLNVPDSKTRIRNNCPYLLLSKLYFLSLQIRTWNYLSWFSPLKVGVGAGGWGRGIAHNAVLPGG